MIGFFKEDSRSDFVSKEFIEQILVGVEYYIDAGEFGSENDSVFIDGGSF